MGGVHRQKIAICMALMAFIAVFISISVISLTTVAENHKNESEAYWKGKVDEKLNETEKWHQEVREKIDDIHKEIKTICSDITEIKIKAAQNGAFYGGITGIGVYLISMLGQFLKAFIAKNKK